MGAIDGLNEAQLEAVEYLDGPLLVISGVGVGKTRLIVHRIARLVELGVPAKRITALTFTNKAANEMKTRARKLTGKPLDDMLIGTFHSVCSRILRAEGYTFLIYDEGNQEALMKQVLRSLGMEAVDYREYVAAVSRLKDELILPGDVEGALQEVYATYQQGLLDNGVMDFGDLIMNVVFLLEKDKNVLERWQERCLHLMLDEFQDTNVAQSRLVGLLGSKYRNVVAVGDEDQCIYEWRSADIRNIMEFEKDFAGAKVIKLEQNYRSTKRILEAAQAVVRKNSNRREKVLWTNNPEGEKVRLWKGFDRNDEANWVIREIRDKGYVKEGKVAVLFRTNAQSRALESACLRYKIPCQLVGLIGFYDRKEIRDLLAYLRVIVNPKDSVSFSRVMKLQPGIGESTVDSVETGANRNGMSMYEVFKGMKKGKKALEAFSQKMEKIEGLKNWVVDDALNIIVEGLGYRRLLKDPERWDNVLELMSLGRGKDIREFLEQVVLQAKGEDIKGEGKVVLMTLHSAKGLEFPCVFMVGMEEGVLPHSRSFESVKRLEEERRLCFVGMTRAEKMLYMTWSGNKVSEYVKDIPEELKEMYVRGA